MSCRKISIRWSSGRLVSRVSWRVFRTILLSFLSIRFLLVIRWVSCWRSFVRLAFIYALLRNVWRGSARRWSGWRIIMFSFLDVIILKCLFFRWVFFVFFRFGWDFLIFMILVGLVFVVICIFVLFVRDYIYKVLFLFVFSRRTWMKFVFRGGYCLGFSSLNLR